MEGYTFLGYVRLRILTSLLRLFLRFAGAGAIRQDTDLAATINVERKRIAIPSRDRDRHIQVDVYSPRTHTRAPSPVLVNWHGSGFIFPLLGSDTLYISQIVRDTGITVIDADYRKGPDTTFPGPLEDAEDTLRWVASQDRFDSARIGLSGFSAGGNIALAAASDIVHDISGIRVPVVVTMYPVTDLSIAPEAKKVPKPKRDHSPFIQHLINDCYAPNVASRKNPRASPSAADPSRFPPTVAILTCDGDIFEPEASALADKLEDGSRKVIHRVFKDVHHGFDKGCVAETENWAQREEAYALIIKTLQEALEL